MQLYNKLLQFVCDNDETNSLGWGFVEKKISIILSYFLIVQEKLTHTGLYLNLQSYTNKHFVSVSHMWKKSERMRFFFTKSQPCLCTVISKLQICIYKVMKTFCASFSLERKSERIVLFTKSQPYNCAVIYNYECRYDADKYLGD